VTKIVPGGSRKRHENASPGRFTAAPSDHELAVFDIRPYNGFRTPLALAWFETST
jgi:hypothetical protein